MPAVRRVELEKSPNFCEIAARIRDEASIDAPVVDDASDRSAPPKTVRASFNVHVDAELSDVFYNGIAGLRAHYWASPAWGDAATLTLIATLRAKLLASVPAGTHLFSRKGVCMTVEQLTNGLELPSDERQLRLDGAHLFVARWAENETEPCNPRLWRWTPRATIIKVRTGWLSIEGAEWIPACKRDRAQQIHRWGFS
jgi:hypothetical protein